jgi:hypothetical protein
MDRTHFVDAKPLGERELALDVFGARIRFTDLPADVVERAKAQYAGFLNGAANGAHVVSVRRGASMYLPVAGDRFMSLEMRNIPEGTLILSNYFAALRSTHAAILLVSETERPEDVMGPMENYVRWMVAETVVRASGVVLHSAGIARDGRAHVFFGASGAGKSTVTQLSSPWPALSDDLVLLRKEAGGWHACSTPFAGSYPQHKKAGGSYPIAGLYMLQKSDRNAAHPVESLPVAVGMLAAAAPFLSDRDRLDYLLPLLEDLCRQIPVFQLEFLKDASFWSVIL